ncbi:MAG TPA: class I SAM-dependent methyltransferase [Candidatus Babeliaceae bacterium]|nr:class I SAM-dependent methyltransferase [Candidatus Babeliaceae bacterium]
MIRNHTELLNAIIEKYELKSYLEIGVQTTANNFDKITAPFKMGCDPKVVGDARIYNCTSDQMFLALRQKFDLIFIDGLHHADQVKRDFENSLRVLNDNGFILIHDCLPQNFQGTVVPRQTKVWWGDVYKFCMTLRFYSCIDFVTFNIDHGCCLIWKDRAKLGFQLPITINWQTYCSLGKELLKIKDEVVLPEFKKTLL